MNVRPTKGNIHPTVVSDVCLICFVMKKTKKTQIHIKESSSYVKLFFVFYFNGAVDVGIPVWLQANDL